MSRVEQEHFWLHLNLKRVDEQAVRRKIYGLVLDRLVPYAIAGLFLVLAGTVAIVAGVGWEGMLAVAGGPGVLLVGTGVTATSVLRARPGGGLSALVGPATDIRQAAADRDSQAPSRTSSRTRTIAADRAPSTLCTATSSASSTWWRRRSVRS